MHGTLTANLVRRICLSRNVRIPRRSYIFGFTPRLFRRFSNKGDSRMSDCEKEDTKSLLDECATYDIQDPPDDGWSSPVYPTMTKRSQAKLSVRPNVDPKTTSVLLFPGQGVQYVGMAKSLLEYDTVQEMFKSAGDILHYNLLDLCLNGPKQSLDDTVHCQVAVVVASLAAIEKLKATSSEMIENCVATAGFSVGEYTALVFAGALKFEEAVKLLRVRGEAMQSASEACPSGMMTVIFRPQAKVNYACSAAREWCLRRGIDDPECCVAIYLCPDIRVIAGHMEALKFLEMNAPDLGIKKIKYIPVSGAFHTKLMTPAREALRRALESAHIEMPMIPVHSNIDGRTYINQTQIRKKLLEQISSPVKWEQIMHVIYERPQETSFPYTFECGPGRSLTTLLKQNNAKAFKFCKSIGT